MLQAYVKGEDVEGAIKFLKRKLQREGVFRDMRNKRFFVSSSEKRKLATSMLRKAANSRGGSRRHKSEE